MIQVDDVFFFFVLTGLSIILACTLFSINFLVELSYRSEAQKLLKDVNRSPVDINYLKSAIRGRKEMIFMTAKVLGTRDLDFKANDGKAIRGRQVFVCYKSDHVDGEFVDKVFIQHDSPLASVPFKYGQEYDFVYEVQGFRGKPVLVDIKKDGKSLVPSVMGNF